ncbi:MAG: glycosyltransferase family 4 protein [Bryobacterales bacterium]|nr:glycosyltransferase family 4 protein [Bryobacterales bacterium]
MARHSRNHKRPLKVLMTADTIGGVWTFAMELCEGLTSRGIEIMLATLGRAPSAEQLLEAGRIPRLHLRLSDFRLEWMNDPWSDVEASGEWLLRLESEFRPDVVHLNSFGHGGLPWRCPVVLTAHSCVASWWQSVKGEPLPPSRSRYKGVVMSAVHSARCVTTPSRAILETLQENYGLSIASPHVRVIPNGRRADRFCREEKEEFVFASGRLWDCAKGIDTLAAIAHELPWPVFLAGERALPGAGRCDGDGCRMLGRLTAEEMAGYYSWAPIYVLPARYEPFGLSALEAALSGCALILGDIPSLREIWGKNAIFVPPGDAPALAAAIRRLIDNAEERDSFARLAYRRALHYDADRMTKAYLSVYSAARQEDFSCVA